MERNHKDHFWQEDWEIVDISHLSCHELMEPTADSWTFLLAT
ncbi:MULTISPECIES: hypothetical protein [Bacillaceae]|uniref:Uncharacterized protein n=1 Tax=Peribacillus huizhouensis TaxID=1501239 RepID=A0ABR6CW25_9BACI|nr:MULTISPECIES: hypothetical protein [Bacillaceae]MBA9029221.1 hypothetical protein [Peribacillus huizhouensis]